MTMSEVAGVIMSEKVGSDYEWGRLGVTMSEGVGSDYKLGG